MLRYKIRKVDYFTLKSLVLGTKVGRKFSLVAKNLHEP